MSEQAHPTIIGNNFMKLIDTDSGKDDEVVSINSSDPRVIRTLNNCLKVANEENVENCVVIMTHKDGSISDCWANGKDPFVMVGALEMVKREFMDSLIESRDD